MDSCAELNRRSVTEVRYASPNSAATASALRVEMVDAPRCEQRAPERAWFVQGNGRPVRTRQFAGRGAPYGDLRAS
jgi:hypothetical protein